VTERGSVPPLPGPLLQLAEVRLPTGREGDGALCFGGSGCWISRCLDEKGQGIAAAMPYRILGSAFFCGVVGEGLVREVWTGG
jgi:hypothetical protein